MMRQVPLKITPPYAGVKHDACGAGAGGEHTRIEHFGKSSFSSSSQIFSPSGQTTLMSRIASGLLLFAVSVAEYLMEYGLRMPETEKIISPA